MTFSFYDLRFFTPYKNTATSRYKKWHLEISYPSGQLQPTLIFFVTNDWFPKRVHHSLAQTIITWSHKSRFTDLLSPTPCARQSISVLVLAHRYISHVSLQGLSGKTHTYSRVVIFSFFVASRKNWQWVVRCRNHEKGRESILRSGSQM